MRKFSLFILILSTSGNLWGQAAGDLRVDGSELQFYNGSSWISADNGNTPEVCTQTGNLRYNTVKNRLEYCDGANYHQAMGFDSTNPCPTPGAINWDGTNGYVRVCNGLTNTWWSIQRQVFEANNLVVRYFLNEAASGTDPDYWIDSGPGDPMHLTYIKSGTDSNYTNIASGRGLYFNGPSIIDGGYLPSIDGTKLFTAMDGATEATFEMVADVDGCQGNYSRMIWADSGSSGGRFAVGAANGSCNVRFSLNSTYDDASYNMSGAGRHVYHIVFDSSEPAAADRVKLYVDGVYEESFAGNITLNETITGLAGQEFWVGNRAGTARAIDGTIYYVAIYDAALSESDIGSNAAILINNDDDYLPCTSASNTGDLCSGGTVYLGNLWSGDIMITPSGCTDGIYPTCDGGPDTVIKTWNDGSTNYYDIPGLTNLATASNPSLEVEKSEFASPLVGAITAPGEGGNHAAAQYCENMVYAGYSDWHLPSKTEMALLYCNSDSANHNSSYPDEDANCVGFGGRNPVFEGFAAANYWVATESSSSDVWLQNFDTGQQTTTTKDATAYVRCIRRFNDQKANPVNWSNFTHVSSEETISGISETITLSLVASDQSGTPNYAYSVNNGHWVTFTTGSPGTPEISPNDTLKFMVFGTTGHVGRITVNNTSDGSLTLDTLDGTVDPDGICTGGGNLATLCQVNTIQKLPGGYAIAGAGDLQLQNGGELQGPPELFIDIDMSGDVTINSGGHIKANITSGTANSLTIHSGGSINLDGLGAPGGEGGFANGSGTGGGPGDNTRNGHGASHGGLGGRGTNNYQTRPNTYGSLTAPITLGSGGGAEAIAAGGDGGGVVRFTVSAQITVDGTISVDGTNGEEGINDQPGGGSGGSIWLEASTMTGNGTISARGGSPGGGGNSRGGGGGGGRVAFDISGTDYDFFGTVDVSAIGTQWNPEYGYAGTLSVNLTDLDSICDTGNWLTGCTMSNSRYFGEITLSGTSFTLASSANLYGGRWEKVTINATSDLTIEGTIRSQSIDLVGGDITVTSTGVLDASVWGERGNRAGIDPTGFGPGGGGNGTGGSPDHSGGGAGHAAAGGDASVGGSGGSSYGSSVNPTTLGSGGGWGRGDRGGDGGGVIKIDAGTNVVNMSGSVTVDGESGDFGGDNSGGPGSAGSIWLIADVLAGNGNFSAAGGDGIDMPDTDSGGASGGYIYLDVGAVDGSSHTYSVAGGVAYSTAQPGGNGIYTNTAPAEDAVFVLDARYANGSGSNYASGTGCSSNQTWYSLVGPVDATLTNFSGCTNNGWDGDGSSTDQYRLKFLDSANDYVSIPDDNLFSFTDGAGTDQAFSVEAWVWIGDMASNRTIFAKQDGSNSEWWLYVVSNGRTRAGLSNNGGSFSNRIGVITDPGVGVTEDAWNHIIMTYDGSETYSGISLYINGSAFILSDDSQGTYNGMANTTSPVTLGTWDTTSYFSLQDMTVFKVYNSELDSTAAANKCNALSYLFDGHTCP